MRKNFKINISFFKNLKVGVEEAYFYIVKSILKSIFHYYFYYFLKNELIFIDRIFLLFSHQKFLEHFYNLHSKQFLFYQKF